LSGEQEDPDSVKSIQEKSAIVKREAFILGLF